MEKMSNVIKKSELFKESELPKCQYCGKSYIWFTRELFSGENKRIMKIAVPDCKCMETREKEKQQRLYLLRKKSKLDKLFSNSLMTEFFKEKTFNNLSQTIEVLKCKEYARVFTPKKSEGISLTGAVGTGKTTLLAAICNELMTKGYSCLFTTFSDLLDKFSDYAYDNAGNIKPLLSWLVNFDFIVLDDLGREKYTEKRKETAFRIIDSILNSKTVMAYTANTDMLEKLRKIPELTAMLDRLEDTCKIKWIFNGSSLRGKDLKSVAQNQSGLV